jgi:Leucine-rich repeat (LRR) protein
LQAILILNKMRLFLVIIFVLGINYCFSQSNNSFSKTYSDNLVILEDSLNIKINSLSACFKYGENVSIKYIEAIKSRLREIATKDFEDGEGYILTWGTDGNCVRYGKWYDKLTKKYHFEYVSVNCSCIIGKNFADLINTYNSVAYEFLNKKNPEGWETCLENEILERQQVMYFLMSFSKKEIKTTKILHLNSKSLKTYPIIVSKFQNLEELYFNFDSISQIDKSITNLQHLKILSFKANQFVEFPKELTNLKKLEELDFSQNQITILPKEITKLSKLKYLNLGANELSVLPDGFHKLGNLETLILTDNNFTKIPPCLYKMKHLKYLFIKENYIFDDKEIEKLREKLPKTEIR